MALGAVLFVASAASAQFVTLPQPLPLPQTPPACGPEVKEEVVKALSAVENLADDAQEAVEKEVYAKYQYCAQDAATFAPPTNFLIAARECGASVSQMGSIFYEEMSCAGYDPQRRLFAAPIKIKQVFGFGPAPLPGSREHVLHCVADANGVLVPVARNSVHLANSVSGPPTWQFAVIAGATWNLQTVLPLNGATRRARSILSWQLTPTDCNYQPIWGNALNYRIRLDP
jgi:hypothetical protein